VTERDFSGSQTHPEVPYGTFANVTVPAVWGVLDSCRNLFGKCRIAPEGLPLAVAMGQNKLNSSTLRRDLRSFEGTQFEADKWLDVGSLKNDPACCQT